MPTHRPKLFLSYARDDDASFVGGLYGDLRSRGFSVWWDRASMPSRALTFLQEIRDAVDACDRLIIVLGPRAVTSDYVRAEWQYALVASKVVIPILRVGTYDLLPAELTNLHCPDVRDTRAYPDALAELMRILDDPVPPLASLSGVPAAPPHFQPRPDDLTRLAAAVLLDLRRPGVVADGARSTVLHGMAGVGKSVLAAAFARSTEVRRAFSDGVFWLRIGPRPDWSTALATLRASLPGGTALGWDLDSARSRLAPLLEGRSCLIVLDDLWDVTHAEPFTSAMGPRCRVLVTSRDGGLVTALGAVPVPLDLLSEDAALRHLADWSGAPTGSLPPVARAVAEECGRLPLAIALCGALARDGVPWVDLHAALREADLAFVEKQFPNYPYPNLLRSLQVSMEALARMDPEAARRYGELVVFAPGVAVPEAAVLTLWLRANGSTERDARKVLSTLAQKALLRCDGTAPRRAVVLHDLQYDYLHASRPGLTALHQELVEAYRRMSPGGWTTSPDDGYWRARLSYHLSAADRWDELCALLTETPEWLEAQFRVNAGHAAYTTDIERALEWLKDPLPLNEVRRLVQLHVARHVVRERVSVFDDQHLQALVWLDRDREAASHTRLRPDVAKQFAGTAAVFAALRERGRAAPELLAEMGGLARVVPGDARSEALRLLSGVLVKEALLDDAWSTAREIQDPVKRCTALTDVACALAGAGRRADVEQVLDQLREAARLSMHEDQQSAVLARAATSLVAAGELAHAATVARDIPWGFAERRTALLHAVTLAHLQRGDTGAAMELASETFGAASRVRPASERASLSTRIGAELARTSLASRAVESFAIARAAAAAIVPESTAAIYEVISLFPMTYSTDGMNEETAMAFGALGRALEDAGYAAEAAAAFATAESSVREIGDGDRREKAVDRLRAARLKGGAADAGTVHPSLESDATAILRLAREGRRAEAEERIRCRAVVADDHPRSHDDALQALTIELVRIGHRTEALACARLIRDPERRALALHAWVLGDPAAEGFASQIVEELFRAAADVRFRSLALQCRLTASFAAARRRETALPCTRTLIAARRHVDDPFFSRDLSELIGTLAATGYDNDADRVGAEALRIVGESPDSGMRSHVLGVLVTTLAHAGCLEIAKSTAATLGGGGYAHGAVAHSLAARGRLNDAREFAVQVGFHDGGVSLERSYLKGLARAGRVDEGWTVVGGMGRPSET